MRFAFGPFVLDGDTRQLFEGERELHLEPKAFDLLSVLVADCPKVLSKTELQHRLWPDTFVAEANLSNLVAELRSALGDNARSPQFIRTAHGVGYAFCSNVAVVQPPRVSSEVPCWLEWGQQRFALSHGEHIIGRDSDLSVSLDSSTVSRRHALLRVSADGTTIEDEGSKNGTFLGDREVRSATLLTDGDLIHIGSIVLRFRARGRAATTDTQPPKS